MKNSDSNHFPQARQKFQQGQRYFEAGRYKDSILCLQQAYALVEPKSKAAGEIQIWLITAYDALGDRQKALQLSRQLSRSPYIDIRKQAKRLLVILEAPKLSVHDDWITKIPSLDSVDGPGQVRGVSRPRPPRQSPKPKPVIEDNDVDLSQVTTSDRGLVIMASVLVTLLGLGLTWLARG